jgi:hypothetical protein
MNWGYRILILYSLFIVGILTMVYKSTQQKVELVSENYYEQEVQYQDQYNRMQNSNQPENKLVVNAMLGSAEIQFPSAFINSKVDGKVTFFRPDNKNLDFSVPVELSAGIQKIQSEKLTKGYWKVQIYWNADGKPFYQESKVHIQ